MREGDRAAGAQSASSPVGRRPRHGQRVGADDPGRARLRRVSQPRPAAAPSSRSRRRRFAPRSSPTRPRRRQACRSRTCSSSGSSTSSSSCSSSSSNSQPQPARGHDKRSPAREERVPDLHLQLHRPAPAAVRLQPVRRRALDLRPGAERAGHARLRHRPGRRAADPRLGPDRHRLPRDGRPQRHDQHPARGLDLGRRHRLQGHHQVRPHRGVAQLPQLQPAGHHGPAALGPGVRGRLRQAPRRLHRELAQHPGERDLRRRRPLDRRLDAHDPVEARRQGRDRDGPVRPAPFRRQVEGRQAPARRRDLHPADRAAGRGHRQRQQPGHLRAQGPDHPGHPDGLRRRPRHHRAVEAGDGRAHRPAPGPQRRPAQLRRHHRHSARCTTATWSRCSRSCPSSTTP